MIISCMADFRDSEMIVIVVDDDEVLLNGIVESVRKMKVSAEGHTSGNKAYAAISARTAKLGAHKIKLVICDWMMSDGDGIDLLNKLRAREETRTVPFILMSGAVSKAQLDGALKHDPDGIMLKPFGLQVLPERMRAAVDMRDKKELDKLIRESGL